MPALNQENQDKLMKGDQLFLKVVDPKQKLMIQSKGWFVEVEYIPQLKKMVFHSPKEGFEKIDENSKILKKVYYWGQLDNETGVVELPISMARQIWETEKQLEVESTDCDWIVGKKGSGTDTEYSAIRRGEVVKLEDSVLEANYANLTKIMERYESNLKNKYDQAKIDLVGQVL